MQPYLHHINRYRDKEVPLRHVAIVSIPTPQFATRL